MIAVADVQHRERVLSAPESAMAARRALGHVLAERAVGRMAVADATHVLYELVMNGVEHGVSALDDTIEVAWSITGRRLEMSVHDCGTGALDEVTMRPPTPDQPGGRGLAMVEAFSDCWSADRADGTRVTACLTLTA